MESASPAENHDVSRNRSSDNDDTMDGDTDNNTMDKTNSLAVVVFGEKNKNDGDEETDGFTSSHVKKEEEETMDSDGEDTMDDKASSPVTTVPVEKNKNDGDDDDDDAEDEDEEDEDDEEEYTKGKTSLMARGKTRLMSTMVPGEKDKNNEYDDGDMEEAEYDDDGDTEEAEEEEVEEAWMRTSRMEQYMEAWRSRVEQAKEARRSRMGASMPFPSMRMPIPPPRKSSADKFQSKKLQQPDQSNGAVVVNKHVIPNWALDLKIDKIEEAAPLYKMVVQSMEQCIYWLPAWMRNLSNSQAYEPQVVSLGPFYRWHPNLRNMQMHKFKAVMNMTRRSNKSLEQFLAAVDEVAPLLRSSYGSDLKEDCWGEGLNRRPTFVEMMVMDGCFFLEVMRLNEATMTGQTTPPTIMADQQIPPTDPATSDDPTIDTIFSMHGFIHYLFRPIQTDMLLLENQLPLLLLKTLASVAEGSQVSRLCSEILLPSLNV
jgi:hypothetical protein